MDLPLAALRGGAVVREIDLGEDELVHLPFGRVRPKEELVHGELVQLDERREPLAGEGGPLELVRDHEVVQVRDILLPRPVLLYDRVVQQFGRVERCRRARVKP